MKSFKKLFFLIIFFFCSQSIISQTAISIDQIREMNNIELMDLINKAKSQNISMLELIELAESQGATIDELNLIRDLFENGISDTVNKNVRDKESINSSQTTDLDKEQIKFDLSERNELRFGSEFFNNDKIVESPQLFISTPKEYVLGPGDEILIELFGASNATYDVQVSREGNIKIDRLAPIFVSGLTMEEAQNLFKIKFSKIYSGLNSSQNYQKVMLSVTLAKARSIIINIIGQVNFPGTYTVPGFTSVLNALFVAGGPNDIGSYRKIAIIREGKIINKIDLYDYFVGGVYPNFFLRDQDVIQVYTYEKLVDLNEGFKISKIFELKDDENFSDLLKYSGGFLSNFSKTNVYVSRFLDQKSELFKFNKKQFENLSLTDGDKISLKKISDNLSNDISISGEVYLPGKYPYYDNINLKDLIENAGGFTADAFKSNISIIRKYELNSPKIISVNESNMSLNLERKDSVIVSSLKSQYQKKSYLILGEVKNPGNYDYYDNLTINDIIKMSGGVTAISDINNIKVYRNKQLSENDNSNVTSINAKYDINNQMDSNINIPIENMDIIVIPKIKNFNETEYAEIRGYVAVQGVYAIKNNSYNLKDLISDAGGLSKFADPNSIFLQRKIENGDLIIIPYNKRSNPVIKNRDIVIVKKLDNTVSISGEVFNSIQVEYKKGIRLRKLISLAGGLTDEANLKKAYYINSDNSNSKVKRFLFFRYLGKDFSFGSQLIIPKKPIKNKRSSAADLLGISSALASIVALLQVIK